MMIMLAVMMRVGIMNKKRWSWKSAMQDANAPNVIPINKKTGSKYTPARKVVKAIRHSESRPT